MDGQVCPRCRNPLPVGAFVCLACGQPISVKTGTAGPASRGGRLTGNRQDRRPFLATIGAGLACGLIWSAFVPPDGASDDRVVAWPASATVIGVVAGLLAGVAGRPFLLMGWYLAAVGAVMVALPLLLGEDPDAIDAVSAYAMVLFVMFSGGPAVAAFGLGWVIRTLRSGRPP